MRSSLGPKNGVCGLYWKNCKSFHLYSTLLSSRYQWKYYSTHICLILCVIIFGGNWIDAIDLHGKHEKCLYNDAHIVSLPRKNHSIFSTLVLFSTWFLHSANVLYTRLKKITLKIDICVVVMKKSHSRIHFFHFLQELGVPSIKRMGMREFSGQWGNLLWLKSSCVLNCLFTFFLFVFFCFRFTSVCTTPSCRLPSALRGLTGGRNSWTHRSLVQPLLLGSEQHPRDDGLKDLWRPRWRFRRRLWW